MNHFLTELTELTSILKFIYMHMFDRNKLKRQRIVVWSATQN